MPKIIKKSVLNDSDFYVFNFSIIHSYINFQNQNNKKNNNNIFNKFLISFYHRILLLNYCISGTSFQPYLYLFQLMNYYL